MKIAKTAVRYVVVGFASFLIDFSLTWISIHFFPLLAANTLGFVIANGANFLMGHQWVFGHPWERKRLLKMYFSVFGVSVVGLVINNFIVWGLVVYAETSLLLAKVAATAVVMGWNFLARLIWIYNNPPVKDRA